MINTKHKLRTSNIWPATNSTLETRSFLNTDVAYFISFQIRYLEIQTGIFHHKGLCVELHRKKKGCAYMFSVGQLMPWHHAKPGLCEKYHYPVQKQNFPQGLFWQWKTCASVFALLCTSLQVPKRHVTQNEKLLRTV